MYTLKKNNASHLCILCMVTPQIIPLLTVRLVHTWYEASHPRVSVCGGMREPYKHVYTTNSMYGVNDI